MKQFLMLCMGIFIGVSLYGAETEKPAKIITQRGKPQYLSTLPTAVQDTCPGQDIINRFTCAKDSPVGLTCFDVYRVQGDPVGPERYTLLNEDITTLTASADPACNFEGDLSCENFLKALNYNLDFSWFIDNFPSSSFPQCQETYTCTRLACFRPLPVAPNEPPRSQKLTCVFKKNQLYFLGTEITCTDKTDKAAPAKKGPAAEDNSATANTQKKTR